MKKGGKIFAFVALTAGLGAVYYYWLRPIIAMMRYDTIKQDHVVPYYEKVRSANPKGELVTHFEKSPYTINLKGFEIQPKKYIAYVKKEDGSFGGMEFVTVTKPTPDKNVKLNVEEVPYESVKELLM